MGELHNNSENPEKSPPIEKKQPEVATPSEGNKEKLVPKENDANSKKRDSSESKERDEQSHPKLKTQETPSKQENDTKEKAKPNGEVAEQKLAGDVKEKTKPSGEVEEQKPAGDSKEKTKPSGEVAEQKPAGDSKEKAKPSGEVAEQKPAGDAKEKTKPNGEVAEQKPAGDSKEKAKPSGEVAEQKPAGDAKEKTKPNGEVAEQKPAGDSKEKTKPNGEVAEQKPAGDSKEKTKPNGEVAEQKPAGDSKEKAKPSGEVAEQKPAGDAKEKAKPNGEVAEQKPDGDAKDKSNRKIEGKEISPSDVSNASKMLKDPDLFKNNKPSEYHYGSNKYGKEAWGNLSLSESTSRNNIAQRSVGGLDRRSDDDGGHLIGARFGGSEGAENLEPQNRNLNRGAYKQLENKWANSLANGDKVFVYSSSYKPEGSDRPEAFIGYSITEHPDGSREYEPFHCLNESRADQEAWDREANEFNSGELPNVQIRSDLPDSAFNKNGSLSWKSPFDDTAKEQTLEPGTYLRYGDSDGSFITRVPDGVDIYTGNDPLGKEYLDNLQTPYEYDKNNWRILDVKEPIDNVKVGPVAPQEQFGIPSSPGDSWQAQLPKPIDQYDSIDVHIPYWNDTIF